MQNPKPDEILTDKWCAYLIRGVELLISAQDSVINNYKSSKSMVIERRRQENKDCVSLLDVLKKLREDEVYKDKDMIKAEIKEKR